MTFRFEFADKSRMQEILPFCFEILHNNMNKIAPTGNTREEDFEIWYSQVFPAMQKEPRQIILMYDANTIVGYFQYYIFNGTLMMEEIQIKSEYHGTGLFRTFYVWFTTRLPDTIEFVEAYSHKNNTKSQKILEHMGLKKIGDSENNFRYKGRYEDLVSLFLS